MKFIVDDKIPYIKGVLEPFGEVVYLPGSKTTPEIVREADALITRTRTICNEQLLSGSSVKFIATATIGYDHIDTEYCKSAGIEWVNAPGCNSKSVEQYILSALFVLAKRKGFELKGKTIGVVGVGQVGSKVAHVCELLGMRVLLNDPPRARKEDDVLFCSLDEIMQEADIITFHVPLKMKGEDATFHMADDSFFESLKRKPILINSCRGEVFNTSSAKKAFQEGLVSGLVIDCWENEPNIDLRLLRMADLATPHIAGYSRDGKANGTSMSVQAVSRFFGLGLNNWKAKQVDLPFHTRIELDGIDLTEEEILSKAALETYDISSEDTTFRKNPESFELLRGNYPVRREYEVYTLITKNTKKSTLKILSELGFKVM